MHNLRMIVAILVAMSSQLQSATLFNYQGRLLDTLGNPVNTNISASISVYTNSMGGSAVYTESIGAVIVQNGLYSFNWGAAGYMPDDQPQYIEVALDGVPLAPRARITAAPLAALALNSYGLGGIAASNYLEKSQAAAMYATGTPVYVESDPAYQAEKSKYATGTPVYVESDPQWAATSNSVWTAISGKQPAGSYATGTPVYAESDPIAVSQLTLLQQDVRAIYNLVASINANGWSTNASSGGQYTQVECFNGSSNGLFGAMVSVTSTQDSSGVYLHNKMILTNLLNTPAIPNPVTYVINDKVKYINFALPGGNYVGGNVQYTFNFSDSTSYSTQIWNNGMSFSTANLYPGKTVTTITRTSSHQPGSYFDFVEPYWSMRSVQVVIKLADNVKSCPRLYFGGGVDPRGGTASTFWELLDGTNGVIASSSDGYVVNTQTNNAQRVRLNATPIASITNTTWSLIKSVSITGVR